MEKTIGIDARLYGPQVKGLGRYAEKLIEGFAQLDHNFKFKIFLNKQGRADFKVQDSRFEIIEVNIPWYGLEEQLKFPKILESHNLDLMHFLHFNVPYFYNGPYVMTLHDLILLDHPSRRASKLSWLSYYLKYGAYRINLRHSLKNSQKIITISEYSRSRIYHHFPFVKNKVEVTLLAGQTKPELKNNYQPQDFGINQPYLLYVGNAFPHKNLEFLIEAFYKFFQSQKEPYQLVLVGKSDYFYQRLHEFALNLAKNQGINSAELPVKFFGYATEDQLAMLYQHAELYVFPSLDEGFGLPPLEAMQYRLPVLSSNQASMPEILGDAAAYFNPMSEKDCLAKINLLINEPIARANLAEKGEIRVNRYNWSKTAKQTLDIYNQAIS